MNLSSDMAAIPPASLAQARAQHQLRLDDEELAALEYALQFAPGAKVYLFGSRTQANLRGGDIDLLLLTEAPAFETAQAVAAGFFSRCEEKLDVVVMNPSQLDAAQSDFLKRIHSVRLR